MVARVRELDPQFFDRFPADTRGRFSRVAAPARCAAMHLPANSMRNWAAVFPSSSIIRRAPWKLWPTAYRAVVGLTAEACPDSEAIDLLLNPARNPYRRETLNIGVHSPAMRALQHANFTFAKKISHTADSQDQRHRMVPGSRPLLTLADTRDPDVWSPC